MMRCDRMPPEVNTDAVSKQTTYKTLWAPGPVEQFAQLAVSHKSASEINVSIVVFEGICETQRHNRSREHTGFRVGYTRVSTVAQTLEQQQGALGAAGVTKVFSDVMSGARDDRPGLTQLLANVRAGDTVVVWKLDRLGRNTLPSLRRSRRSPTGDAMTAAIPLYHY